ncbi:MAG TPA: branched-chain amino acid ABC transporter permease [Bacilli bacterium]|nr:branched-chain amino acid ABC transporter permease [Bacilli bacterium]
MQIIISGLIFGCIYGLAAIGMILIYRTSSVVNFAQGEMAMVTTFVSFVFLNKLGFPFFLSFLLSLLFAALLGVIIYQLIMKRVQTANHTIQNVVTLGLFLIINGIAGLIWGYQPASYPEAIKGSAIKIGSVHVTPNELFILGITLTLMLLFFLLFQYSKIGLAMRASSQDYMASELMGIKVSQVFMATWIVAAVLGGVSGMLTAPMTFLSTHMMFDVLIMAFAAAVLGGFVSLPGAIVGGLLIGVFENLISYYIAPEMKVVYVFLLIVLVLYIRPQGIFGGAKIVKKV